MASGPSTPHWLESLLQDTSAAPTLFRWDTNNIPEVPPAERAVSSPIANGGDERRRIHILGLGNIGRLFAMSLSKLPDRPPITLVLHRKALLGHWRSNPGVEIIRGAVTERSDDSDVELWSEEPPESGPVREVETIQNLVVATKAPDALLQVDRLRRYLGPTSTVVFTQNGMNRLWPPHGAAYSRERFSRDGHPSWLACVVTHGVTSLGPFRSLLASPADAVVGPILVNRIAADATRHLLDQIEAAPDLAGRSVSTTELWVLQLEKLVVNSIINPLTAVLRCKNGVLFAEPEGDIVNLIDILLFEASHVLQRLVQHQSTECIVRSADGEARAGLSTEALLRRFSFPNLRAMLHRVGDKVRDNTSSMLQDVLVGKRTEVREFNGWLVETAQFLGADLDVGSHETLAGLVERGVVLEKSRLGKYFPALLHLR